MLEQLNTVGSGATAVGVAWAMKEIFAFILKWEKARQDKAASQIVRCDHDDDDECQGKPEKQWQNYCIESFDDIKKGLSALNTKVEVLGVKVEHLENMQRRK